MLRKGYERLMCERWDGVLFNCNILTPSSSGYSSTSFSFSWAAQPGVLRVASPQSGAGSHAGILSPKLWLQLTELPVAPSYIMVYIHLLLLGVTYAPNSTHLQSRYPRISSTGCTCYLHKCISYLAARSGRRSMLH